MSFFTVKDEQGRQSRTLTFVTLAVLVLVGKFALGGNTILGFVFAPISATELGGAFLAILAPWLGREWMKS